jgi:SAM-dependent methyltransferase
MGGTDSLEAARLWREALLLPGHEDLARSLATELAEYAGGSVAETLAVMADAQRLFAERWNREKPAAGGTAAVTAFYNRDLLEAYELSNWHAGGQGAVPLVYPVAALWLKGRGARRVLDYGSGIGSGALVLARAGLQPDLADIARPLLGYASARLRRRGIDHRAIDLNVETPPPETYDAICCLDVLEHVPDPLRVMAGMTRSLKLGGALLCNLPGADDGHHPMHITAFRDRTLFMLRTDVYRDRRAIEEVAGMGGDFTVLRKRRFGRLRNHLLLAALRLKRLVYRQAFAPKAATVTAGGQRPADDAGKPQGPPS